MCSFKDLSHAKHAGKYSHWKTGSSSDMGFDVDLQGTPTSKIFLAILVFAHFGFVQIKGSDVFF